jgi:hypothetical protein
MWVTDLTSSPATASCWLRSYLKNAAGSSGCSAEEPPKANVRLVVRVHCSGIRAARDAQLGARRWSVVGRPTSRDCLGLLRSWRWYALVSYCAWAVEVSLASVVAVGMAETWRVEEDGTSIRSTFHKPTRSMLYNILPEECDRKPETKERNMANNAQQIIIGVAVIEHFDCNGCFDGKIPVTIRWRPGARNPAKVSFDTSGYDNVNSVKIEGKVTSPTPAEIVSSGNKADIGISGCLNDPCKEGSFVVTATSSIPLQNSTVKVTIPALQYSVIGLKDTNGTSDKPNKPFVPITIQIKDCRNAGPPRLFRIVVSDVSNCAALRAVPNNVNLRAGLTSPPITISGNKVDGTIGAEFLVRATPPAPVEPCKHAIKVE